MFDETRLLDLVAEIKQHHRSCAPASNEEIAAAEVRFKGSLPNDLKAFYSHTNGASLCLDEKGVGRYHILPVAEIARTRTHIFGQDSDEWGPDDWYSIVDVEDGNFVALRLSSVAGGEAEYLDVFHETFGPVCEAVIVAKSFCEFLQRALKAQRSLYWLKDGFKNHGVVKAGPPR